jgi:hypothetical protein
MIAKKKVGKKLQKPNKLKSPMHFNYGGMLNATDGSEDHLIKVQGCDDCSSWWRRL